MRGSSTHGAWQAGALPPMGMEQTSSLGQQSTDGVQGSPLALHLQVGGHTRRLARCIQHSFLHANNRRRPMISARQQHSRNVADGVGATGWIEAAFTARAAVGALDTGYTAGLAPADQWAHR